MPRCPAVCGPAPPVRGPPCARAPEGTTVTKPAAVLVDMDGTLIDSEPTWFQAEVDLLAAWGFALGPEHYPHVLGKPMLDSTTYLLSLCGGLRTREELEDGVELAMIERLRTGVPM